MGASFLYRLTKLIEGIMSKKGYPVTQGGSPEFRAQVYTLKGIVKSALSGTRDVILLGEIGYQARGESIPFKLLSFEEKRYYVLFAKAALEVLHTHGVIQNLKVASVLGTIWSLASRYRRELTSTIPLMFRRHYGPDLLDELEDNFSVAMENAMDDLLTFVLPPQLVDFIPTDPVSSLFEVDGKLYKLSTIIEGSPKLSLAYDEWDYLYGDTLRIVLGNKPKYDRSRDLPLFLQRAGETGRALSFLITKLGLAHLAAPILLGYALIKSAVQAVIVLLKMIGMSLDVILDSIGLNIGFRFSNEKTLLKVLEPTL